MEFRLQFSHLKFVYISYNKGFLQVLLLIFTIFLHLCVIFSLLDVILCSLFSNTLKAPPPFPNPYKETDTVVGTNVCVPRSLGIKVNGVRETGRSRKWGSAYCPSGSTLQLAGSVPTSVNVFLFAQYMRLFFFYPQASNIGETHSSVPATEELWSRGEASSQF